MQVQVNNIKLKDKVYKVAIVFDDNLKASFKTTTHSIVDITHLNTDSNSADIELSSCEVLCVVDGRIVNDSKASYMYEFKVEEDMANKVIIDDVCDVLSSNYRKVLRNMEASVDMLNDARSRRFDAYKKYKYYHYIKPLEEKYKIGFGYRKY